MHVFDMSAQLARTLEGVAMADTKERRDQISVTLDRELRAALERAAQEQRRTLSNQARFFIAEALERQGEQAAA